MKFINEIIELFNNLSIENIIDIGIGLAIIVIFKIFSSFFAYILIKMFKFKNNKIKENGFYVPLKIFFVILLPKYLKYVLYYLLPKVFQIYLIHLLKHLAKLEKNFI